MTKFTKNRFYIPLSYFMWDVKFDKTCNIYCFRTVFNDNMSSVNGDEMLSKEIYKNILKKIKEIMGNEKRDNLTDLEKCILVSNYLQRNVQYVAGLESEADKIYVVDAKTEEVTRAKVGSVNSVINENYGLCMAIANTTTLMLNNPVLNVNIRSLKGDSHVWNLVDIDKKLYYIDNTWNITRNKNRVNDALKATSFTDEYLLFGENKAINIGYHNTESYINGDITMEDYSREAIKEKVNILSKNNSFKEYPNKLRFKSKIKN